MERRDWGWNLSWNWDWLADRSVKNQDDVVVMTMVGLLLFERRGDV
ncbi:MAG: hypothetical protein SXQ77_00220 [Halobacteria archaeon]|nr:hypothetical protein [Halobacteria archaeon]